MGRYGMPYMGSKNNIAEWVVSNLPQADRLYDLFGGGGAITDCASAKFTEIHYNEYDSLICNLFKDVISGEYTNENRWISRDDFYALKDSDAYVRLCWSFGNNCKDYMYGRDIEPLKKAAHYAIFFNDFRLCEELGIDASSIMEVSDRHKRYLSFKKLIKDRFDLQSLERLERLESLESLERLQSLERLERLEITNLSFDEVSIKPNSVIYCDPPYINTSKYQIGDFNHLKFYEWCESQKELVIISEYWMPDDKFTRIAFKNKRQTYSATNNTNKKEEGLYVCKDRVDEYKERMGILF